MKILHLLSIFLLVGSISSISDLNWNPHDEELVGGKTRGSSSIQLSIDNSERLTNGVFDLYRILSSNNDRLNQIVSNVHQTVGKDTYSVNHVFKHIKNGNYYVEIDTDKYNFAINVVRMPISQHSHNDGSIRPTTARPTEPVRQTTSAPPTTTHPTEPVRQTPTTARPTTNHPPTTAEAIKQETTIKQPTAAPPTTTNNPTSTTKPEPPKSTTTIPKTTAEPVKQETIKQTTAAPLTTSTSKPELTTVRQTEPSTTSTTLPPKTTATQQEIEKQRTTENKRFNQILGQWLFAGVKSTDLSSNYGYMACDMITIFTHGTQFFYKVLEYKGNGTYEMHDTHIESVDKKNSQFKMGSNVYSYKLHSLNGNNYKVRILQITNLNNSSEVSFFTELPVKSNVLTKAFSDHFSNLQITRIQQVCDDD